MPDVRVCIIPGASLMRITPTADGLRMTCPGCRVSQDYRGAGHHAFPHGDDCPIHARIVRALQAIDAGAH